MNSGAKKLKMQGKKPSHRRALIKGQLNQLIRSGKVQTTPSKAKILKAEFDRLITEAKKETQASKRRVSTKLENDRSIVKLYESILPKLQEVNSGYALSARTLPRKGDNADQMIVVVRGMEFRERKSRLAKALEKQEKSDTSKDKGRIRERFKGVASKVSVPQSGVSGRKGGSSEHVRRVST